MRQALIVLAAAVLLVALAPVSADARSVLLTLPRGVASYDLEGDAALAGSQLVYEDFYRPRHPQLRVAGPGARDRLVRAFTTIERAASSRLAAVLHPVTHAEAELYVGPPTGPMTLLERCAAQASAGSSIAVDGTTVAYVDDDCGAKDALPAVVVRDLANASMPPRRFTLPTGGHADFLALAGRYVAYRLSAPSDQEIVVDDGQSGAQALQTAAGSRVPCGQAAHDGSPTTTFCGLALQADGKVAELLGQFEFFPGSDNRYDPPSTIDTCAGTIDWFSPNDPSRHRVWGRACTDQPLRFAADRILFANRSVVGIGVVNTVGDERDLGEPNEVYGFDGQHVVVEVDTCLGDEIVSESALGDAPPLSFTRGSLRCPRTFPRVVLVLGRRPRLVLTHGAPITASAPACCVRLSSARLWPSIGSQCGRSRWAASRASAACASRSRR